MCYICDLIAPKAILDAFQNVPLDGHSDSKTKNGSDIYILVFETILQCCIRTQLVESSDYIWMYWFYIKKILDFTITKIWTQETNVV